MNRVPSFHPDAHKRGETYGIMPIGARQFRQATIAEVVHFKTCNAEGPFSRVNVNVPPQVPVWQYVGLQ